jgi:hypothetical protein
VDQVAHHHRVLIAHQVLAAHLLLVDHNVVAADDHNVAVLAEHLVRMQARAVRENQNLVKLCAMNSTICKHQNWVAQLFRTVMVQHQFECVAVHPWPISLRRLRQIQQR